MVRLYLACENIRSAYNVGNILRTADGVGRGVILLGYSPHPDQVPKVKKTSLGAEDTVDIKQFKNFGEMQKAFAGEKTLIIGAETTAYAKMLPTFSRRRKSVRKEYQNLIVLVGNEVYGIDANTLNELGITNTVAIPMKGTKSSLNVGQASAILMWELR